MEDIKYSTAIAEDAAAVIALHRKRLPRTGDGDAAEQQLSPETLVRMLKGREQAGGKQMTKPMFEGSQATFYEMTSREPGDDSFGSEPVWESEN